MNKSKAQSRAERKLKLVNRKRRIQYRLRDINWAPQDEPMFRAGNIRYELADRVRGLGPGGIGACTCWPGERVWPRPLTAGCTC